MVSMLALYLDIMSLNPAEGFSFSVKFLFGKNKETNKRLCFNLTNQLLRKKSEFPFQSCCCSRLFKL